MGKHGLAIDNLMSAEVVTADGELHTVDADREPDLFWAIRGGGGNLGIVTRSRSQLQALPSIVGGGEARVCEAYPAATWDRLATLKSRHDPSNLFRHKPRYPAGGVGAGSGFAGPPGRRCSGEYRDRHRALVEPYRFDIGSPFGLRSTHGCTKSGTERNAGAGA